MLFSAVNQAHTRTRLDSETERKHGKIELRDTNIVEHSSRDARHELFLGVEIPGDLFHLGPS